MASPANIGVVLLALEWGSKRPGEVSTFNRELAIQLAKQPEVNVSVLVPRCDQEEKSAALKNNVTLIQAKKRVGLNEIQWLSFPPDDLQIDFIIGHGAKLGCQALIIKDQRQSKWIQFVHTDPEELGMFKDDPNAITKSEQKRQDEVDLCIMADCVVAVGPKMAEAYRSYLRYCGKDQDIFVLTPGIFRELADVVQSEQDGRKCRVLAFGHGNAEDFSLKGFDIAAKAVAKLDDVHLIFVGAQNNQHSQIASRLKEYSIPSNRLRVRALTEIKDAQFSEVDLAIMPSRTDGFGLAALQAMSAGLPVLVSSNSGFGEALQTVVHGSHYVISSEEADYWAEKIKEVWTKPRDIRLAEIKDVRERYAEKYQWEEQCKDLVEKMRSFNIAKPTTKKRKLENKGLKVAPSPKREPRGSSSSRTENSMEIVTVEPIATKKRKLEVKPGCPSEEELQLLATELADDWRRLASRLNFKKAEITGFDSKHKNLADKAEDMLLVWQTRNTTEATYKVLYDALCHELVQNRFLAEKFCCP